MFARSGSIWGHSTGPAFAIAGTGTVSVLQGLIFDVLVGVGGEAPDPGDVFVHTVVENAICVAGWISNVSLCGTVPCSCPTCRRNGDLTLSGRFVAPGLTCSSPTRNLAFRNQLSQEPSTPNRKYNTTMATRVYGKKCPRCGNTVHYREVRFPAINDHGLWFLSCTRCSGDMYEDILNPFESGIVSGAKLLTAFDDEMCNHAEVAGIRQNHPRLEQGMLILENPTPKPIRFDVNKHPLFCCSRCEAPVESLAYAAIGQHFPAIANRIRDVRSYLLKDRVADEQFFTIHIDFECVCHASLKAVLYTPVEPLHKPLGSPGDLLLADVSGARLHEDLEGIFSKTQCLDILEKLIIRWRLFFAKTLIVTPFVGHNWLSHSEQCDLWSWMLEFANPHATEFVTRRATVNKYKKAAAAEGIPLDALAEYDFLNPVISEFTEKTDFHAKVYGGIDAKGCEIVSGSFNIVRGPSVENMSFRRYTYAQYQKRFVDRLRLPLGQPQETGLKSVHVRYEQGGWNALPQQDVWELLGFA